MSFMSPDPNGAQHLKSQHKQRKKIGSVNLDTTCLCFFSVDFRSQEIEIRDLFEENPFELAIDQPQLCVDPHVLSLATTGSGRRVRPRSLAIFPPSVCFCFP